MTKPLHVMPRALLLHAHPGQELRLFHWMEVTRPIVLVLTDGSGGGAAPGVEHTVRCVRNAGATYGALPGIHRDRSWYHAILRGDVEPFHSAVDAVVRAAASRVAELVVSDAADGYNPMHDLCEAVGAAAVARLAHDGPPVAHLVSRAMVGEVGTVERELRLDGAAIRSKRAAIDAYGPLAEEANRLRDADATALAVERLRRPCFAWPDRYSPEWEVIGRGRVASQRYGEPILYADHVRPIARVVVYGGGVMPTPLRILITNLFVAHNSGSETVVELLADGLRRAGHVPMAPTLGTQADRMRARGDVLVDRVAALPART